MLATLAEIRFKVSEDWELHHSIEELVPIQVVGRMVLPIPPAITTEMAKGFTLYMVKAVMGGRADDLVDLARANLWA